MRWLSKKALEQIAIRVTNSYRKLPIFETCEADRIDPELLAENLLGLKLDYDHALSRTGTALGLTTFEPGYVRIFDGDVPTLYEVDGQTILVDSELKANPNRIGRCNFTIMHETSHHVLNMLFPNEYSRPYGKYRVLYCMNQTPCRARDWEEWQTNVLASAMFLPRDLLEQAMRRFGLGDKLFRLNKIYNQKEYQKFVAVSEFFGVSKKALSIRMKQLGLLEQDYLDDPQRLVRIEMD